MPAALALVPWRTLGAYFASMLVATSMASIPLTWPTLLAVKTAPPWSLAVLGSLAAAISAAFDYHVIRGAFRLRWLERVRRHRLFDRAARWANVAPFLTIVAFAALPLPFLIMRVLMPLSGYPLRRYALATTLGRFPRILVIATFGQIFEIPTPILIGALIAGVVFSALGALARRVGWTRGGRDAPADPPAGPPPT